MAKNFVRILGTIFVLTGIVGFFFPFENVFDLTTSHNIVHLASGVIALLVSGSETRSAAFSKIFGFIYLLVAVLGLFTHEFIGIHFLMADNVLHFIIAFASLYVGFASAKALSQSKE
ncbi:DUF4383 domain-containing protein [Peribacillus alkalitolerans]|uniref:DUF4383 domain-containing protein n=1 Tax=Peribacillus alkalitolerans TaxID=1550385 RepID=UPI0013D565FA|nr:DUF4383 domain-containing protein [Peribacillus alkalitolerans]